MRVAELSCESECRHMCMWFRQKPSVQETQLHSMTSWMETEDTNPAARLCHLGCHRSQEGHFRKNRKWWLGLSSTITDFPSSEKVARFPVPGMLFLLLKVSAPLCALGIMTLVMVVSLLWNLHGTFLAQWTAVNKKGGHKFERSQRGVSIGGTGGKKGKGEWYNYSIISGETIEEKKRTESPCVSTITWKKKRGKRLRLQTQLSHQWYIFQKYLSQLQQKLIQDTE